MHEYTSLVLTTTAENPTNSLSRLYFYDMRMLGETYQQHDLPIRVSAMDASGQYLAVCGWLPRNHRLGRYGWQIYDLATTTTAALLDQTQLVPTNVSVYGNNDTVVCAPPLRLSDDARYIMASTREDGAVVHIWSPDGWAARLPVDKDWGVRPVVDMVDSMMVIGGAEGLFFADFGGRCPPRAVQESTLRDLVK